MAIGKNERMPLEQLVREGSPTPITRWGAAVMHRPSQLVDDFGLELWNLLCTMFATNRAARGAGLAAPQVGVDLAVFVYDTFDASGHRATGLVCNPDLEFPTGPQRRLDVDLEGCLSLPGAYSEVARPSRVICRGQDQFGNPVCVVGTGSLARCLQHETDHLAGTVLEDRLSAKGRRAHRRQHRLLEEHYPRNWPA